MTEYEKMQDLSVGLGDTLELVLLLDGVAVGGSLGGVDQLVSETLGNGLDVAESGLAGSGAQQPDGLVDPSERRHIHGLSPDGTGAANTGGVLAGSRVDDHVNEHLEGVLAGQQVDDLEAVLDNPDGQQLLAVVPAVRGATRAATAPGAPAT